MYVVIKFYLQYLDLKKTYFLIILKIIFYVEIHKKIYCQRIYLQYLI